ncbi:MAG UNVERIFIED_CONTAM: ATP synthase F1 subunit epsilon [Anaerolineae bacterium]|jgi:F-type H+-transporting ATPase subunit epsilon
MKPAADIVIIPASEGEMGVLPNHAPVLTTLNFGDLVVRKGSAEEHFAVYGGVVDVRPDKVVILADMADVAADLDVKALEAARERARKLMAEGVPGQLNQEAIVTLRRAELALKIKNKLSSGGSIMRIITDENDH